MRYQIETDENDKTFVLPLDGPQAGMVWKVTFTSPEAAREAILTVSRIGKTVPAESGPWSADSGWNSDKATKDTHPLIAIGRAVQEQRLIPDYEID